MLKNKDIRVFLNSNNIWLGNHPSSAIIFSKTRDVWTKINQTYLSVFRDLVFGEFPDEGEILDSLLKISDRLKDIEWNIDTIPISV